MTTVFGSTMTTNGTNHHNGIMTKRKGYRNSPSLFGIPFCMGVLVGCVVSSVFWWGRQQSCISSSDNCMMTTSLQSPMSTSLSYFRTTTSRMDNNDDWCISKEPNGWSLIHVFYGNTSHIADASAIPLEYYNSNPGWFSQLRQDQVVSKLLRYKTRGYFVDLAANDAVRISNTYALETKYDWQGLCLEPNPLYWAGLSYRENCRVVAAVVGSTRMEEVKFRYPNRSGPKGGIVGKEFDNREDSKFNEDHWRFTVTLLEIFERFDTPNVIDYLSLDVEGAEELIMKQFPFDKYRFNVLSIERPSEELSGILESHGYKMLKQLKRWGEQLWIHTSIEETLDMTALDIDTQNYKYREFVKE